MLLEGVVQGLELSGFDFLVLEQEDLLVEF
jgi:hypothetical protein